ncbi:MAG: SLBB domain-containing protein, partial [Ignavibacteriales bacterium]|nr:SLBB domain-containing protein [Ignavibacteriales bacterium]
EKFVAELKKDEKITPEELKFSTRDILLQHADGSSERLDLERFRLTGDYKHNPYLKRDDLLIFPSIDLEKNFVSIKGAIVKEGRYQFVDGDRLQDIILLCRGYDKSYDKIDEVRISRLSIDGDKETLLKVQSNENPALKRGDRITVISEENNRKDFAVYVNGAVKYPGNVPITKNQTTLYDVLQKDGGFSPDADIERAELLRGTNVFKSSYFSEEFENFMMNRMANITIDDSLTFFIDNKLRYSRANGTIDFNRLSDSSSQASKFIVQNGDYISIPEKVDLVYVFGHVFNPGYVQFVKGNSYEYYLQKAGGIGQSAKDEIYLIKGKTRSWVKIDTKAPPSIEAGDYIWIPKEPTRTFEYYLTRIQAVAGVVSALATIILLVVQLSK